MSVKLGRLSGRLFIDGDLTMRLFVIAAAAALLASPSLASPAAKTAVKGPSKMAGCAAQWKALGASGQAGYNTRAKTMKSKKGGSMSGYNAWTGECMKKGA